MKQIVVVLLLIVICCSACSQPSPQIDSSSTASEAVSAPALQESEPAETSAADSSSSASETVSAPTALPNNNEHSSKPEPEEPSAEADTSDEIDYQGFTQEQWNELQKQKEEYGHLSKRERGTAAFNGEIECPEFEHLWWEHNIALQFVHHVGGDNFEAWLREIDSINNDDHCTIYSFAEKFSVPLDYFVSQIESTILAETYDLETLKRRYEYFIGDSQE